MLSRFEKFVKENQLFEKNDRILLGFSGGPDSVALAHLLLSSNAKFALAHVNFHLRGKDAEEDQQFSLDFAKKLGVEFFTTDFDTKDYATKHHISIEQAARELRYAWFNNILRHNEFDYIATAHNADDNVETVLHNLARGTGIKGLLGIPIKRNRIIRPLLFAFKNEILAYCKDNNLTYRIDKTNQDIIITRNRIRHRIIPEFEIINPGFKNNVLRAEKNLQQVYALVQDYVNECIEQVVTDRGQEIIIRKEKLNNCKHKELFIYQLLSPMGFSPKEIENATEILSSQPGKIILGKDYQLLNDRQTIILMPREQQDQQQRNEQIIINSPNTQVFLSGQTLKLTTLDINNADWHNLPSNIAMLNMDKLHFPLVLRHWQDGDFFYPLGMKGRKKLSNFFTDKKIPLTEKNKIWILESDKQIVWIVGLRLDNRFKITSQTKKVLKITLNEAE